MSTKATSNTRSLRKRVKTEYNDEYDDEYEEELPEEKKRKTKKKSIKMGVPNSYSSDSKDTLGSNDVEKAIALFETTDPDLSDFIKRCDDPHSLNEVKMTAYQTLVKIIISQQLSTTAAGSIINKFIRLFLETDESVAHYDQFEEHPHFPKPEAVKESSPESLRSAGMSFNKAGYVIAISEKFSDKNYPLSDEKKLADMTNQEIAEILLELKGIGPWAVDIFLMIHMKRSDIFPIRDAGIRRGLSTLVQKTPIKKGNKLNLLSIEEMEKHGENWKPYRSVASWYLMKLTSPQRIEGYFNISE